jgi:Ni,Fe-hydrogenase I large subunit
MAKIYLDPLTRTSVPLSLELEVRNGRVADAWCRADAFTADESILKGRNPADAVQLTQRMFGSGHVSHAIAASIALESAMGVRPGKNARLMRNLILGAEYLKSHLTHFYLAAVPDYFDIRSVLDYRGGDSALNSLKETLRGTSPSPFLPRFEGDDFYIRDAEINRRIITHYLCAFEIIRKADAMIAAFGGRAPHPMGIVPGGLTQKPYQAKVRDFREALATVESFITDDYLTDVMALARLYTGHWAAGGFFDHISFGAFPLSEEGDELLFPRGVLINGTLRALENPALGEETRYSRRGAAGEPAPGKRGAYSWLKAARYGGRPLDSGALSRLMVSYHSGNAGVRREVDELVRVLNIRLISMNSVMGRHFARALEAKFLCGKMREWLDGIVIDGESRSVYEVPEEGRGEALADSPEGALRHRVVIRNKKIDEYSVMTPASWALGPRDNGGGRGPLEQALIGTPVTDPANPLDAARVARSF